MKVPRALTAILVISTIFFLGLPKVEAKTTDERRVADSSFPGLDTPGDERLFTDVFFDQGEFRLREDAKPVLKVNAEILMRNPDIKVVIEAYCNNAEYNLDSSLGQKRAENTKAYLTALGVESYRMSLRARCGDDRDLEGLLAYLNPAWRLNSRVHFIVVEELDQNSQISRKLVSEGNINSGSPEQAILTTLAFPSPIYCYFDTNDSTILKYIRPSCEIKHYSSHDVPSDQRRFLGNESGGMLF